MSAGRSQMASHRGDDDALAGRLARIRGRMRLLAALDGAVAGGAAALIASAIVVAVGRWRGWRLPLPALLIAIAAVAVAGALVRAGRRISLLACARKVDAILDQQDRVLSALSLAGSAAPLARAAVADALARTERVAPAAAAPGRRPAGLPALVAGTAVLALAFLIPSGTRAARLPVSRPKLSAAAPLPASALEVERAAIAAALARAQATSDPTLGRLGAALDRIVRGLADGTIDPATALEALRALDEQARAAAEAAARDAQAAAGAAKALSASAATREAADALRRGADDDQASAALASSAARAPAATGSALHEAAAAIAATAAGSSEDEGQPGRRRLKRDEPAASQGASGTGAAQRESEDRKLERLSRDLDETASRCAQGDPSCRGRAESGGRELSQLQREGASSSSLRDLSRATRQLHDRVARGDLRNGDSGAARAFSRAAAGGQESGKPGDGNGPASAAGGTDPGGQTSAQPAPAAGKEASGGGTSSQTGEVAAEVGAAPLAAESSAGGAGIGHENGGAPLGARDTGQAAAGRDARVPVADGPGPSRAQVIDGAAGRGFASRPYARVYTEYRAAVEEALGATGVPPGQQYLVRRYFDLIRPRSPRAGDPR